MTNWVIRKANHFEKSFTKHIPKQLQEKVNGQIRKLLTNPYVGRPLGFIFFREKKIEKWRIYFLIYKEINIIYLVNVSDKKSQQSEINKIKALFKEIKRKFI